jgi:hypothetical protein
MATTDLDRCLNLLRRVEPELRSRGVLHAALFGSVARGEATDESDVDVLVELDPERHLNLYEYAALRLFLEDLIGRRTDLADRKNLHRYLRESILAEAVRAF